jgi:hypothetical protein
VNHHHHGHLINAVGYVLASTGAAASGLVWFAGQGRQQVAGGITMFAQAPTPDVSGNAGLAALSVGITGLVTLFVNAVVADRKARAEVDARLAERKIDADARFGAQELRTLQLLSDSKIEGMKALAEALSIADRRLDEAKAIADATTASLRAELAESKAAAERREARINSLANQTPSRSDP